MGFVTFCDLGLVTHQWNKVMHFFVKEEKGRGEGTGETEGGREADRQRQRDRQTDRHTERVAVFLTHGDRDRRANGHMS